MQLGLQGGDFRIAFCGVNDRWIDRSPRGGLKLLREICRESVNVAAQGSRIGGLMGVPESRTGVNQQGRTRRPVPINRRLRDAGDARHLVKAYPADPALRQLPIGLGQDRGLGTLHALVRNLSHPETLSLTHSVRYGIVLQVRCRSVSVSNSNDKPASRKGFAREICLPASRQRG